MAICMLAGGLLKYFCNMTFFVVFTVTYRCRYIGRYDRRAVTLSLIIAIVTEMLNTVQCRTK